MAPIDPARPGPAVPAAGEGSEPAPAVPVAPAPATDEAPAAPAAALAHQLVAQLAAMVEPWARLLEATRATNRALVAGDPAVIEAALAFEEECLRVIGELERRRFDLQRELAAAWGLDPACLSWDELARRVPDLAPALARCRDSLKALAEGVEQLNRQNRALARQGLAWARFGLQSLAAARGTAGPGYGPDGQLQWRPPALAVDRAF
ncbi:flagellar protein FlgN [Thermaerobacter sp. PB12/4term]|uniref:flagellar protein FlgN n=1 Tax=Thermaerobacter sp. PB12/4term TaxID=2293838 RepID=UPI000E32AA9F|nr:flagellar protein FlgN [Thermaerobacter sp. PB12/4term]QIA26254.1 flagellar protein FlgN [Thermaerobacter sp. PB12/4term]